MAIPSLAINAPEVGRRRYGLFDAANGPLDLPQHGQISGVRYVPNGCGVARAHPGPCVDGDPIDKPFDGDDEEIDTGVFAVFATMNCTQVGYTEAQLTNKALRRLEGSEQKVVEQALWSGLDFEGNALGILNLNAEAVSIPSAFDPDDKTVSELVGALEKYAYTTEGYGFQAVIHAPVEVAAFAFHEGLVMMDGNRKVTPMGSIWSFGAYPSGSVTITGQTTVWRSDIQLVSAFNRVTNERSILAERTYAVSFECFAGRAEYDPLEVTSP